MNIKTLRVRHTRDRYEKPLAIVLNMPGEGMEASPDQLRQFAAAFLQAAADCETRETRGKYASDRVAEYQLDTPLDTPPAPT